MLFMMLYKVVHALSFESESKILSKSLTIQMKAVEQ